MAAFTQENFHRVKDKEKVFGNHTTETIFRAAIQTISKTAGENSPGKTDKSTKGSSRTTCETVWVVTVTPTVKSGHISGSMVT